MVRDCEEAIAGVQARLEEITASQTPAQSMAEKSDLKGKGKERAVSASSADGGDDRDNSVAGRERASLKGQLSNLMRDFYELQHRAVFFLGVSIHAVPRTLARLSQCGFWIWDTRKLSHSRLFSSPPPGLLVCARGQSTRGGFLCTSGSDSTDVAARTGEDGQQSHCAVSDVKVTQIALTPRRRLTHHLSLGLSSSSRMNQKLDKELVRQSDLQIARCEECVFWLACLNTSQSPGQKCRNLI